MHAVYQTPKWLILDHMRVKCAPAWEAFLHISVLRRTLRGRAGSKLRTDCRHYDVLETPIGVEEIALPEASVRLIPERRPLDCA